MILWICFPNNWVLPVGQASALRKDLALKMIRNALTSGSFIQLYETIPHKSILKIPASAVSGNPEGGGVFG